MRRKYRGRMPELRFYAPVRKVGMASVTLQGERTGFRACVTFGKRRLLDGARVGYAICGTGRNPRKAVASAFRQVAANIGRRKGAFAGAK